MSVKNFYPSKPVVPFQAVNIGMQPIIDGIRASNYIAEIKRSVYILGRNETGNGKSVVNGTNIGGVQSDNAKWPDKWDEYIVATSVKAENRTGKERGFIVFNTLENGIAFMCERLQARGIYVGGDTKKITQIHVTTPELLAVAYYREWVTGQPNYDPDQEEINNFISMYKQASKIFT